MSKGLEKFENLVEALSLLPSVGRKSALRFAYHLLLKDNFNAMKIANAIESAIQSIRTCERCGGLSEHEICDICLDDSRDTSLLCIVESPKDILIFEENNLYDGFYYVLNDLEEESIEKLRNLINVEVKEIVFALTPSLSNDAVILFIEDKLQDKKDLHFSKIAQGVPTGVHLENVDMLSLSKALQDRTKA